MHFLAKNYLYNRNCDGRWLNERGWWGEILARGSTPHRLSICILSLSHSYVYFNFYIHHLQSGLENGFEKNLGFFRFFKKPKNFQKSRF